MHPDQHLTFDTQQRLDAIALLIREDIVVTRTSEFLDSISGGKYPHRDVAQIDTTSSHNYPPELEELIGKSNGAWILDCGSGPRKRKFPNVIHFEIEPFMGVDVVGLAENLPFRSNSFEMVFSLAVLEHVKDPFTAISEMKRVLKPNGLLWIDTAFMQPYHAYPAHYYNMTQQGLENLVGPNMKILRDTVPRYGTPIWSLSWIVSRYASSLEPDTRKSFLSMPISELLQSPEILCERDFATQLPENARKELAATVSILARKLLEH